MERLKGKFVPSHESAGAVSVKVAACSCYMLVSAFMTICNKFVVGVIPDLWTLLLFQSLFASVVLCVSTKVGVLRNFNPLPHLKGVLPLNVLFVLMLYSSLQGIKHLTVPTVTVLKNLCNVFTVLLDCLLNKKNICMKEACGVICALYMISIGAVFAGFNDLSFNYNGCLWMLLNAVVTSLFSLYASYAQKTLQLSSTELSYCNNLLAVISIVGIACVGAVANISSPISLKELLLFPIQFFEANLMDKTMIILSGGIGTLLGACAFWCISATSPSTYAFMGAMNKVAVSLLGASLFLTPLTQMGWMFVFLNLCGGIMYVYCHVGKPRQIKIFATAGVVFSLMLAAGDAHIRGTSLASVFSGSGEGAAEGGWVPSGVLVPVVRGLYSGGEMLSGENVSSVPSGLENKHPSQKTNIHPNLAMVPIAGASPSESAMLASENVPSGVLMQLGVQPILTDAGVALARDVPSGSLVPLDGGSPAAAPEAGELSGAALISAGVPSENLVPLGGFSRLENVPAREGPVQVAGVTSGMATPDGATAVPGNVQAEQQEQVQAGEMTAAISPSEGAVLQPVQAGVISGVTSPSEGAVQQPVQAGVISSSEVVAVQQPQQPVQAGVISGVTSPSEGAVPASSLVQPLDGGVPAGNVAAEKAPAVAGVLLGVAVSQAGVPSENLVPVGAGLPSGQSVSAGGPAVCPRTVTDYADYGRPVEIDQYGFKFTFFVHPESDNISRVITDSKQVHCRHGLLDRIQRRTKDGKYTRMLDIGSTMGSCAIMAGLMGVEAWAFEPLVANAKLIQRNIEANGLQKLVHLVPCALGNSNREDVLNFLPTNMGHGMVGNLQERIRGEYVSEKTHVVKLDDFFPPDFAVDFINMDTQGNEWHILDGARGMFQNVDRRPYFSHIAYYPHLLQAQGVEPPVSTLTMVHDWGLTIKKSDGSEIPPTFFGGLNADGTNPYISLLDKSKEPPPPPPKPVAPPVPFNANDPLAHCNVGSPEGRPSVSESQNIDPNVLVKTLQRARGSIVIVEIPFEKSHGNFPRDDPRVAHNIRYARRNGYGFDVCYLDDLIQIPEISVFHYFHLAKPHCVFAAQRKYLNDPTVEWIFLLDSDAIINPYHFNSNMNSILDGATPNTLTIVPGNEDYDGCTGVLLIRANPPGLCVGLQWCVEVMGNMYGKWDQTAYWGVLTTLWAQKFPSMIRDTDCCFPQAVTIEDKTIPQPQWERIQPKWREVQDKVLGTWTTGVSHPENEPIMAKHNLAKLYGKESGPCESMVWHPAGQGHFFQQDEAYYSSANNPGRWRGVSYTLAREKPFRRLLDEYYISNLEQAVPLVSREFFRQSCRHACDSSGCNFAPTDLNRGECVFVVVESNLAGVIAYTNMLTTIQAPHVPITYVLNAEEETVQTAMSRLRGWLEHPTTSPKVQGWLSTECNFAPANLNKFTCIPAGVSDAASSNPGGFFQAMRRLPVAVVSKSLLVQQDTGVADPAQGLGAEWVSRMSGDLGFDQWADAVQQHRFVACNTAASCYGGHSAWEVLLVGGFPVLKKSPRQATAGAFEGLPVMFVDDWPALRELGENYFITKFNEYMEKVDWASDRLFFPLWEDEIMYWTKGVKSS